MEKELNAAVELMNTTLIHLRKYTNNKISAVDSNTSENGKAINDVMQELRAIERQV